MIKFSFSQKRSINLFLGSFFVLFSVGCCIPALLDVGGIILDIVLIDFLEDSSLESQESIFQTFQIVALLGALGIDLLFFSKDVVNIEIFAVYHFYFLFVEIFRNLWA